MNEVWTPGKWGVVAENTNSLIDEGSIATLEYPRVAYRPEYDEFVGYITWEKKEYTEVTTGGVTGWNVNANTKIGIKAFNIYGNLFAAPSSNPYITFPTSAVSGSLHSGEIPERASVAISPDHQVWLSFYTINYTNAVLLGTEIPTMNVYFTSGTRTLEFEDADKKSLKNLRNCTFSFSLAPRKLGNFTDRIAMGTYKPEYGAIYFAAPKGIAPKLVPSTGNYVPYDEMEKGYGLDLAAGPSIQIVSRPLYNDLPRYATTTDPRSCSPDYEVGILYCYGLTETQDGQPPALHFGAGFSFHSNLSFYAGHANYNATTTKVLLDPVATDINIDNVDWDTEDPAHIHYVRSNQFRDVRFFPLLKYTNVMDPLFCFYPPAPVQASLQSFFVASYMCGDQKTIEDDANLTMRPTRFHKLGARTGISYDYRTFNMNKYKPDGTVDTKEKYILDNEEPMDGSAFNLFTHPWKEYWGNKLDVSADLTFILGLTENWDLHPIWHRIVVDDGQIISSPTAMLMTNTGNSILAEAYIPNSPTTVSEDMPNGNFFKTDFYATEYPWGDYAYFDFNSANRPHYLLAAPEYNFVGTFGILKNQLSSINTGTDFIPPFTSSGSTFVPYNLYYGRYQKQGVDNVQGGLGTSNQRKIVMTDNIAHAVFNKLDDAGKNKIYYSLSRAKESAGGADNICGYLPKPDDWSPPFLLRTPSDPMTQQYRPSITVYESGTVGGDFNGIAAIAVTWAEVTPGSLPANPTSTVEIYMMTREFDVCSGKWNTWSDPYLIHKHTNAAPTNPLSGDDMTTPVIAPLVASPTNLLGWTVTWSSPTLNTVTDNNVPYTISPTVYGVYSRTWLRCNGTTNVLYAGNANWGVTPTGTKSYYDPLKLTTSFIPTFVGINPHNFKHNFNRIYEDPGVLSHLNANLPIWYPTVTSSENKFPSSRLQQEIAYSTDGLSAGIWHKSAQYGLSGSTTGTLLTPTPAWKGNLIGSNPINFLGSPTILERKPCITVNSSAQTFVSWEKMLNLYFAIQLPFGQPIWSNIHFTVIQTANTDVSNKWITNNNANMASVYAELAANMNFEWLLNPSITGFPKSQWSNSNLFVAEDQDPGAVQICFWRNKVVTGPYVSTGTIPSAIDNTLHDKQIFFEDPGTAPGTTGQWRPVAIPEEINAPGVNSSRSFGTYNFGPKAVFQDGGPSMVDQYIGTSYAMGNAAPATITDTLHFTNPVPVIGTYKGTFDSVLNVSLYRSEEFYKDSSMAHFTWGNVFVADSLSMMPRRQVRLYRGAPDSTGYANFAAMHDSVFRTEVFNWYPGTTISFWRGLLISDSVAAGLGGTFNQPGFALNYVMELVNTVTGAIDTVDRVRFSPCTGEIVIPGSISVTNGGLLAKDVYLRVRQSLSGFTPDSLNSRMFSEITSPSMYPSFSDTSFVFYKRAGKASGSAKQSPLFTNIYPNPIRSGESELNVLFSYPQGYPVTIEMFDQTGKQVTDKLVIESTGENQRVVVMPPKASGAYFVRITAGSCNETYAFSVLH